MSKSWYWNRYVRVCTKKIYCDWWILFCTTMKFRKTFFIYPLYEKCLKNRNALTKILLLQCKLVEKVCVRKLRILYLCDVYGVRVYLVQCFCGHEKDQDIHKMHYHGEFHCNCETGIKKVFTVYKSTEWL